MTAVVLVVAYVCAYRLEFEIHTGCAVPTQLVLVPMLFVLPLGIVPFAVAGSIALACLIDVVRGLMHPERILLQVGSNAWHSVGPVIVLGVAGEGPPELSQWPLYAVALLAQFAFDFAAPALREWAVLGIAPRIQLHQMASVYLIDAGLAPVGLADRLRGRRVVRSASRSRSRSSACWRSSRATGACGSTPSSSFATRTAAPCSSSATWSRRTTTTPAPTAATSSICRSRSPTSSASASRERRDTEFVALLHDVGKVRIPNEIINKPGKLTPEERAIIETHTVEGERMLHRVGGLLGEIGRLVRSCHERWDGTGYPDGLAGEQIPLVARIVCCCDAFNAMTTDRSYRKALPREEARGRARAQPRHAVRPGRRRRPRRPRERDSARPDRFVRPGRPPARRATSLHAVTSRGVRRRPHPGQARRR